MKKVVWGVLSTARIGTAKVIPAMQRSAHIEVRAIASRTLQAAQDAARALSIPKAYGSYRELLADPEIEAVYNPLPNHLHVPLTLEAARAGKHVLCEKPIAITAKEAAELRDCRVHVMEAFMVRFHPQWLHARDLVQGGRIGALRAVQVLFSYFNDDPADIRNQPDIGGGGLYDIGCYAIVAGRFFFGADPVRAVALLDRDPVMRTDRTASGLVDFGGGRHLDFTVSTQLVPHQRVQLCGTRGRIEILIPFNAPPNASTRILVDDGSALDGSGIAVETLPPCDQYTLQGEAFSRAVRGESPLPYGVEDAVVNLRVLDALFRSERSGKFESV
jgi:predicted dehydrogenase